MQTERKALLIWAARFACVALFAYLVASLAASTPLLTLTGLGRHVDPVGFVAVVGLFALPFVLLVKVQMYASGWDGFWHHAVAGLLVGTAAALLIAGVRDPIEIGVFALAGMCGSAAYLGARNLGRRVVRW